MLNRDEVHSFLTRFCASHPRLKHLSVHEWSASLPATGGVADQEALAQSEESADTLVTETIDIFDRAAMIIGPHGGTCQISTCFVLVLTL